MNAIVKKKNFSYLFLLVTLLLSICGGLLVLYATQWGPWAFSDSAAYLSCARNYNAGLGISVTRADSVITPLTLFPPGYSFLLSRVSLLTGDYLLAARIINAVCFSLVICTITWGMLVLTKNALPALVSGVLVLASPVMLEDFTGMMSEALFFFLFYGSFFFTLIAIRRQKDGWLIPAVLLTMLAPLVRYVGVVQCVFNPLLLLLFSRSAWKERMRKALLFASLSILPIASWLIASGGNSHGFGGRSIRLSAGLGEKLLAFFKESSAILQGWIPYFGYRVNLIPDWTKVGIILCALGALLLLDLYFYWKKRKAEQAGILLQLVFSLLLYNILYFIVLAFSCLFASVPPDLNGRMFSPLWPTFVLLGVCGLAYLLEQVPVRWKKTATVLMVLVILLPLRFYALRGWADARELHENGYGYTARAIQNSAFLQALEELPEDIPLISNDAGLVLFYTNRMPYELKPVPNYRLGDGDTSIDVLFSTQSAALILDYASMRNTYEDWSARLDALTAGLGISFQDDIGGVYSFPK